MKPLEFAQKYPDEESCITKLRELREREIRVCPRCGHKEWYWKSDKLSYECKKCRHRESIRKGTVMENSKLPFLYWFMTMHLLTTTKKTFSAIELQRQLGHKRYQPVWEMLHKLNGLCDKLNSQGSGERKFDRLLLASVGHVTDFKHRVYNKRLGLA